MLTFDIAGSFGPYAYTTVAKLPDGVRPSTGGVSTAFYASICGFNAVSGAVEAVCCFISCSSGEIGVRPSAEAGMVFGSVPFIVA